MAGADFTGPGLAVTSTAFADGAPLPREHAGKKVGDNVSPPLTWAGAPADTKQFVLLMEDLDVPGPKPLMHTTAVIDADVTGLAAGISSLVPRGCGWSKPSETATSGPAPIAGHGPHHYRFVVLALDTRVPDEVADHNALLAASAGHVVARGDLTGTYER